MTLSRLSCLLSVTKNISRELWRRGWEIDEQIKRRISLWASNELLARAPTGINLRVAGSDAFDI